MNSDSVAGSQLWQTVFISFAAVLMLFQILRGWRLGLPRQVVRIGALVAAYSSALFGGSALLPVLRPFVQVPDFVISAIGGAILAMIVYVVINTIGAILFKNTGQQSSGLVRLVWGITGAMLGVFFGLFFLWLLLIGIRSIGAVAEAQVNARAPARAPALEEDGRRASPRLGVRSVPDENSLAVSMTRLKRSIELGTFGEVVKQTDVLPAGIYETLTKFGEVFAKPESASRFLAYPGVTELADHPKILALRADPEITRMIEQGRLFELLQDERLIEAANDPELAREVKKFDLRKALEYAAGP